MRNTFIAMWFLPYCFISFKPPFMIKFMKIAVVVGEEE